MNETKQLNAQSEELHVFSVLYQSTCTFLKKYIFYQIATPRSHTVGHSRTRSDIIAHGRTWSNIIAQIFCSKTAAHGRTKLMLIAHCRTQSHRRPCTVEHGCTDDRTQSHTVAQKTAHGRTKNPQLPEWPTLSTVALSHTHQMSINFMYTPECTHHTAGRLC